ncbi:hypothetical protein FB451DRAFT_1188798 [Mycena latifolia]|nr:hypothetical protein FB451DRAFT_1188798 [Mycena latifolia]
MLIDIGKNFAHFIFLRNIMILGLNCKATYWPIREDVRGGRKIPTWVELAGNLEQLQEYAHKDIQFKAVCGCYYFSEPSSPVRKPGGATGTTGTLLAPAPAAVALHRSCSPSLLALCPHSGVLPSPLVLAASSLRMGTPRVDHMRGTPARACPSALCGSGGGGCVWADADTAQAGEGTHSAGDRAGGTDDASGGGYKRRCAQYENETRGGERKGRRTAQDVGSADIDAASSVTIGSNELSPSKVIVAGMGALGQHYNSWPRTCGMSEVVHNKKGNHPAQGSWTDGRQRGDGSAWAAHTFGAGPASIGSKRGRAADGEGINGTAGAMGRWWGEESDI